jgi:hypothetical protein
MTHRDTVAGYRRGDMSEGTAAWGQMDINRKLDLDWLLRVRVVVARCGEMDAQRWWNTEGQLGPYGARVLKRGFPRTHLAQARSVFAVAAHRCAEIFDPPDAVTLWRLSGEAEKAFDARWEGWLDDATTWVPFFESVAALMNFDVVAALKGLSLVDDADVEATARLKVADGEKGVLVPGPFELGRKAVALLALGFGRGARATSASHTRRRGRHEACPGLLPAVPAQGASCRGDLSAVLRMEG